jgi:hypothetical protein
MADPEIPMSEEDMLLSWFLDRAEQARHSPSKFIDFCATDEHRPDIFVGCAPHLEIVVDFVEAHKYCVLILPAGGGKSWAMAYLTAYLLGTDPTARGAIISATEEQAAKPFNMVKSIISDNSRAQLVFPLLRKSARSTDPWNDNRIVIDRPPGIRDASLSAYGLDTKRILGSRLSWIICDDILNQENTITAEQREKVYQTLRREIQTRLDPNRLKEDGTLIPGGRLVICNTAWHYDDTVHRLWRGLPEHGIKPWPTLRMEITGDVWIYNTDWDHPLIRPAWPNSPPEQCRIVTHDPDESNQKPLWPERFDLNAIQDMRDNNPPVVFNMTYMGLCRDDSTAWCQPSWIDGCFERGLGLELVNPDVIGIGGWKVYAQEHGEEEGSIRITGCDLAFRQTETADWTVITTFVIRSDGSRRILWQDRFQAGAEQVLNRIIAHQQAFDSVVAVENNAAQQAFVDMLLSYDASFPVRGITTGKGKMDTTYGLPSFFVELSKKAWILPCDKYGRRPTQLTAFVSEALNFQPSEHSGDTLMSIQTGREIARQFGYSVGAKALDISAMLQGLGMH